jgi:hypothetical protein
MPLQEPIYNPKPNLGGTNAALGAKLSDPATQQKALAKVNAVQPKPKDPIETLIVVLAKTTAFIQSNTYKILWGSLTNPPPRSIVRNPQTGFLESVKGNTKKGVLSGISSFLQSGIFNILDTINGLDLCDIIGYFTSMTNSKPRPRPPKPWTQEQIALFYLQDRAGQVVDLIDKYLALPTTLVRSYVGIEPKPETQQQAAETSGLPQGKAAITGTDAQKFNLYNLLQELKAAFTVGNENSVITAQDATLLSQVPGIGGSLNFMDDFIGYINQYSDYRNINNEDLQTILRKINEVRSICITIQRSDFKSLALAALEFLGIDVRAQIQKLSKVLDPTKLLPTIKQISNQVNAFVKIAQKIYGIISQVQFIIKILIILLKILKFLVKFFLGNALPALFLVMGIIASLEKARDAAELVIVKAIKRLEQINSLMSALLGLTRYILSNAIELLARLEILIAKLEGCDSTKNSAVLEDLKSSYENLKNIKEQLEAYVLNYDGKTDPDNAQFGGYSIRVIDEELTDPTIPNKRRRGVALDANGSLVLQSDLTFATNTAIIIQETKLKLISAGLVAPQFNTFADPDLAVVLQAAQYLENEDVLSEDFNFDSLSENVLDSPDGSDENSGLGLNAFINNLKGGRRLRSRVRSTMDNSAGKFQNQLAKDKVDGGRLTNVNNPARIVGNGSSAPDETGTTSTSTRVGNLSADQRKQYLKGASSGNPITQLISRKKLKDDEAAGGPGRYADPATGLAKT